MWIPIYSCYTETLLLINLKRFVDSENKCCSDSEILRNEIEIKRESKKKVLSSLRISILTENLTKILENCMEKDIVDLYCQRKQNRNVIGKTLYSMSNMRENKE